jgi:hypothetical protein
LHKKGHYVKPFVVCTNDGYILDIYGMFEATLNDAAILLNILEEDSKLGELMQKADTLIVDRGFRDCVVVLENKYGFQVKMPAL